jgi:hypothetical protein
MQSGRVVESSAVSTYRPVRIVSNAQGSRLLNAIRNKELNAECGMVGDYLDVSLLSMIGLQAIVIQPPRHPS